LAEKEEERKRRMKEARKRYNERLKKEKEESRMKEQEEEVVDIKPLKRKRVEDEEIGLFCFLFIYLIY
jgi:hypothetical protein